MMNFLADADISSLTLDQANAAAPLDYGAAFVKMLLTLAALVLLLCISCWAIRKLLNNRMHKANISASIQVLEKRMLSPKTALYLVEINQKKVLLAESQLEIKKLVDVQSTSLSTLEE